MANCSIQQWLDTKCGEETPALLNVPDNFFRGVGRQFTHGPIAVYELDEVTSTALKEFELPEDLEYPPVLLTSCSIQDPTREQIDEWMQGAMPEVSLLLCDDLDRAFLGVAERLNGPPTAVYDRSLCIELLALSMNGAYDDAEEYFEFNVIGAWVGDTTPIFMETMDEAEGRLWEMRPRSGPQGDVFVIEDSKRNPKMPHIRVWPGHNLDLGESDSTGLVCLEFCEFLTGVLNEEFNSGDDTSLVPEIEFKQSARNLWVAVSESCIGMVVRICGPYEDAAPDWALSGMSSGVWSESDNLRARKNRGLLEDRVGTALDMCTPPPAILEWAEGNSSDQMFPEEE